MAPIVTEAERDTALYKAVHQLSTRAVRSALSAEMKVDEAERARRNDDQASLREALKHAFARAQEATLSEHVAKEAAGRISSPELHAKSAQALAEAHDEVEKAIEAVMEIRRIGLGSRRR